jgi:DedD protein
MDQRLKQRLVGAAVIGALVVVFVPMLLDHGGRPLPDIDDAPIPPPPEAGFRERIEPRVEVPPPAGTPPEAAPPAAGPPSRAPEEPAPRAGAGVREEPPPRPAAEPPGDAADPPRGGAWVIQVGSFSDPENAEALVERLREAGFTAFREDARVGARATHRVLVGPTLLRGDAREQVARLALELGLEGLLMRYP